MAKYPDECPVFYYVLHRVDYVLRPAIYDDGYCTRYWLKADNGYAIIAQSKYIKPLTTAARQLLKWSRQ